MVIHWNLLAFSVVPLVAMLAAVGYTLVATYRLRDWRPPLFVFFLLPMSVHQLNEIATVRSTGSLAPVSGFGEYPETVANLTAALSVVLVLRLVGREITLRERLERRVARERELRRENERLDQFASIVSHDLRNPLNVARGRLDMARADGDGEGDDEHLAAVANALERMQTILEETLELARQGQFVEDTERVPVADVVADCRETVRTGETTVRVEDDFAVEADRDRLAQLFENLLRNAVEHAGPDATVRVGLLDPGGTAGGPQAPRGGFYVADDGPGIPPEEREQVFEPGYTTETDGTGFGLAIVRGIAEAHDWSVAVTDAASGTGSETATDETDTPDAIETRARDDASGPDSSGDRGSSTGARFEFRGVETSPREQRVEVVS